MTKAERRKRAREKKRSALREAAGVEQTPQASPESAAALLSEPLLDGGFVGGRVEPAPAVVTVDVTSDYITGPIVPSAPAVRVAQPVMLRPVASLAAEPVADEDERAGEDEDEDEELEGEDDLGEEGDDDDEPLDEQDALFNLACASVEEGDGLSWNELVTWLLAAEVDDPRLALLATLLVTEEDTAEVPKLTGARVLAALEHIDLADMVKEARETVANSPREVGESEEERELVRTTARELAEKAKVELGRKPAAVGVDRPMKASQVRGAQGSKQR